MTRDEYTWWCDIAYATARVADLIEASLLFEPEVFMIRARTFHPFTFPIDGQNLTIHIRALPLAEMEELDHEMKQFGFSLDGKRLEIDESKIDRLKMVEWVYRVVTRNVTVPKGQLEILNEDGTVRDGLTGDDLLLVFGGRADLIPIIVGAIWAENRIPEDKKKLFHDEMQKRMDLLASEPVAPSNPAPAVTAPRRGRKPRAA